MKPEQDLRKDIDILLKKHSFSLIEKKEDLYNSRHIWKNFETSELVILEVTIDYDEYFKEDCIIND